MHFGDLQYPLELSNRRLKEIGKVGRTHMQPQSLPKTNCSERREQFIEFLRSKDSERRTYQTHNTLRSPVKAEPLLKLVDSQPSNLSGQPLVPNDRQAPLDI